MDNRLVHHRRQQQQIDRSLIDGWGMRVDDHHYPVNGFIVSLSTVTHLRLGERSLDIFKAVLQI